MEIPSDNSHSDHHKRERKIVDDPVSSNPHSLLRWLKRQLHTLPLTVDRANPNTLAIICCEYWFIDVISDIIIIFKI